MCFFFGGEQHFSKSIREFNRIAFLKKKKGFIHKLRFMTFFRRSSAPRILVFPGLVILERVPCCLICAFGKLIRSDM